VVAAGDEAERLEQQSLYKGMANYAKYINKGTDNVTQSNASRIG
jgi:hypothetical protein